MTLALTVLADGACDTTSWPDVALYAVIMLGIVGVLWAMGR